LIRCVRSIQIGSLLLAMASLHAFAQTASTVGSFNGTNGSGPTWLIQAQDGNYYGVTAAGGTGTCSDSTGCGTVFKMTPEGGITYLYSFNGNNGASPTGLVQGADGNLYGTTAFGGACLSAATNGAASLPCHDTSTSPNFNCVDGSGNSLGCGTIFEVTPSGIAVLYSFSGTTDGAFPNPLVVGGSQTLYGSTLACSNQASGACNPSNPGVLFSFVPSASGSGTFSSLTNLGSSGLSNPNSLIQGSDGNLYGTAQTEGDTECLYVSDWFEGAGCGGVFLYSLSTPPAQMTTLCEFGDPQNTTSTETTRRANRPRPNTIVDQPAGQHPTGLPTTWSFQNVPISLTEGSDGNYYGTTPPACASDSSYYVEPSCYATATVFQCTPSATLNTVYQFTDSGDGGGSTVGLTLASDGNYYGISGTEVFQIPSSDMLNFTSAGSTSPLPSLTPYLSPNLSYAPDFMIQGNDGNFYGTTSSGGTSNLGSVFEIATSPSLASPVQLSFSASQIGLDSSAELSWNVADAFSMSAQQCYAFVQGSTPGAGTWTGLQTGTVSGSAYSGSASITPTATGVYTYSLTCGGTVSGFATLIVVDQLATLTSPAPNTTLTGSSATFTWTAGTGVTQYVLGIGSTGVGSYDLYNSTPITATQASVTGLPTNGETLYARIYSWINGAWQYHDYTYTAATATPVPAVLTSPTPGSTLTSSSVTFQWTAGTGVTQYVLGIGSTGVGSYNLFNSTPITASQASVTGLPTNGEALYARLYSWINGAWQYHDYTYTAAATPAVLTSPTPSSTLTSSSATFQWTTGTGVTQYVLGIGSTGVGSYNLYNSTPITATQASVTGLPTNGETLYARIYSLINGAWQSNDYIYTAAPTPVPAVLTTPTPGSALTSSSVTFQWTAGTGVTQYVLGIGSTGVGSYNLFNSTPITATQASVTGLPTNGATLYARLYSWINGAWQYHDYTYTAAATPAVLTSPTPSSTLSSSSVTFQWTAGAGVTQYVLGIGSTGVGSYNLFNSTPITATQVSVTGLPTNGETLYARLYSWINGAWQFNDYTYTAQ